MLLTYLFDNIFVMDNLYRLRIFLHLCKTLNFTETARQLHLVQPAISRHIKQLEEEVGSQLFLRYKKQVQLSEAGKTFLLQISPLLSEFDRVFTDFKEQKSTIEGVLRIGSVPEAGRYLLLDHLIQFQKVYPDLTLNIELLSTDQLIDKLTQGTMDFALVSRSNLGPSLIALPLFHDYPVLVGRSDRKKINWDNDFLPMLFYREDDYYALEFIEKNFNKTQRKNFKLMGFINSHEAILNWSIEVDAFSIIPFSSFNRSRYKDKLKVYKAANKIMTLDLIYIKNSISELKKRIFLEEMKKIALK